MNSVVNSPPTDGRVSVLTQATAARERSVTAVCRPAAAAAVSYSPPEATQLQFSSDRLSTDGIYDDYLMLHCG